MSARVSCVTLLKVAFELLLLLLLQRKGVLVRPIDHIEMSVGTPGAPRN